MRRELHRWHSPHLDRAMEVVVYGHWGFALLLFPTAVEDQHEYERHHLIDSIAPFIETGRLKAICVNSINGETWLGDPVDAGTAGAMHQRYNRYIEEEVVPFIAQVTSAETMIITAGASMGAFHAANVLFRRPDLFEGTIAMSGCYDIRQFTGEHFDENCYYNSPVDYLAHLTDEAILSRLRARRHIYLLCGQGAHEEPEDSLALARVLAAKQIPHHLDLWGHDVAHDWPAWRAMLPHVIGTRL